LPEDQRDAVNSFVKSRTLPDKISNELVQGMQTALSGLIAISIKPAELLNTLSDGGAPCTVDQLQSRFAKFVQSITSGKEASKIRLVIAHDESLGMVRQSVESYETGKD